MLRKSSKLTILSVLFVFIAAPAIITVTTLFIGSKSYYAAAVMVIICAIVPFFAYFENRRVKTGEIIIIAIMTALAVAARSLFFFIPQVKPTSALVIVTAIAFGPNAGFLTGALSMFLSNFIFGQGMFTPFQMLGMGLVGFVCGCIFSGRRLSGSRFAVSLTGGLLTFAVYGFIADSCSVLMLSSSLSLSSALAFYSSGFLFNIIHGITTALLLFFICKPMNSKFSRLRIKYGIFSADCT